MVPVERQKTNEKFASGKPALGPLLHSLYRGNDLGLREQIRLMKSEDIIMINILSLFIKMYIL